MTERKNQYFVQCIENMSPANLVPGAQTLLQEIRQAGLKVAVASASKHARLILQRVELLDDFDAIADGQSVSHHKPRADVFLFAAGMLNVPVTCCLAIDDKAANIKQIKHIGMHALGIGEKSHFHTNDPVLPTLRDTHVDDLFLACTKRKQEAASMECINHQSAT